MALLYPAGHQFGDSNMDPVGSGSLYVYENGTTTEASIYSNPGLSTSLSNPVTLDSAGKLTSNVYVADGTSYTVTVDTSLGAEVSSADDIWGIETPLAASIEGIGSSRFGIGTTLDAIGETALTRTMPGVELTAEGMNPTNKYTPAVKFMSTDPQFTTENPKLLAAIAGEAIETYGSDTDGGMALVFFVTEADPGATNLPTEALSIRTTYVSVPSLLRFSGTPQTLSGAGAVDITSAVTHVATTGTDALTLADGSNGQIKHIVMTVDNGAGTLTPSNLGNGSTITFDDVGDSAHLLFTNGSWHFMGGTATLA